MPPLFTSPLLLFLLFSSPLLAIPEFGSVSVWNTSFGPFIFKNSSRLSSSLRTNPDSALNTLNSMSCEKRGSEEFNRPIKRGRPPSSRTCAQARTRNDKGIDDQNKKRQRTNREHKNTELNQKEKRGESQKQDDARKDRERERESEIMTVD